MALVEQMEQRLHLAADEFSIVVLPDTQFYAESYPATFQAQAEWIAANAAKQNVRFVTHVGDIVQNGAEGPDRNLAEWKAADRAMDALAGVAPYSASIGAHDYDTIGNQARATQFARFFGAQRYAGQEWFGGASKDGRNQFQVFSAGRWRFLHISLEYEAPDRAIVFARRAMAANPGLPVLLTTHSYLDDRGRRTTSTTRKTGNSGQAIYEKLVRPNPRIFMVLAGHYSGEAKRVSSNDAGTGVIEILSNYQSRKAGGQGFLRVLRFRPRLGRIDVSTYSPTLGRHERDADSQFSLKLDFDARLGAGGTSPKASKRTAPARPALKQLASPFSTGTPIWAASPC